MIGSKQVETRCLALALGTLFNTTFVHRTHHEALDCIHGSWKNDPHKHVRGILVIDNPLESVTQTKRFVHMIADAYGRTPIVVVLGLRKKGLDAVLAQDGVEIVECYDTVDDPLALVLTALRRAFSLS